MLDRFMGRVSPEGESLSKVVVEDSGADETSAAAEDKEQQAGPLSMADQQAAESVSRESGAACGGARSTASAHRTCEEQSTVLSPRRTPRSEDHE